MFTAEQTADHYSETTQHHSQTRQSGKWLKVAK
jgi:hypothetical protein